MKYFFKVLLTPSCWIQNDPYSSLWDKKLNQLMRENKFIRDNDYHSKIGGCTVWIENHPYASFTCDLLPEGRPSRRTILKAMDRLQQDYLEEV